MNHNDYTGTPPGDSHPDRYRADLGRWARRLAVGVAPERFAVMIAEKVLRDLIEERQIEMEDLCVDTIRDFAAERGLDLGDPS